MHLQATKQSCCLYPLPCLPSPHILSLPRQLTFALPSALHFPTESDSANLDHVAELMVRSGTDPQEALMALVPEAYRNHPDLVKHYPEVRAALCCAVLGWLWSWLHSLGLLPLPDCANAPWLRQCTNPNGCPAPSCLLPASCSQVVDFYKYYEGLHSITPYC